MKILLLVLSLVHEAACADFILWDVGQGQWATLSGSEDCRHFDMGGEKFPRGVLKLCKNKKNALSISHWDFDHISFVFEAQKRGLDLCIQHLPHSEHPWKQTLKNWPQCPPKPHHSTQAVYPRTLAKKENQNSLSFWLENSILITGDSTTKMERRLKKHIPLRHARLLVAGHHGSITSSSTKFIAELTNLKISVVSARKEKYGHPHRIVQSRFRSRGIPLLSTHDWGNIYISTSK